MRLNPRDVTGITAVSMCSSASWFSRIFFAISLTISPSSAAVPQTAGEESNAAEKLVVARATAGKIAARLQTASKWCTDCWRGH